jgi:DNA-directed RNA polymerase subunit RPC12/RpoP
MPVWEKLNCPKCGKEMEKGYVTIFGRGSGLHFSREELSIWTGTMGKETDRIMGSSLVDDIKGNYKKEGYRCKTCNFIVINRKKHDYRGFSAAEGKNEFE